MGCSAATTHVCHHWRWARHCEHQMCAPSRCGEWYQQAAVLPAGEDNAADAIDFHDAFDENANGWEDYCLVVKASAMRLTQYTFMHTTDHKWTVDVLKVLDDMNAPDYAFGNILAWTRGASAAHYSFKPPGDLSRFKSVDLLFDAMPNACQLLPTIVPITCGPSIKNKKEMKTSNQSFKQQKLLDERALAKTVVMDNMDMMVLPNEVK